MEGGYSLVLLRPLTDWMRPTHITRVVRWKSNVGVECGADMDLPPPGMRAGQGAPGQRECVLFWEWIVTSSLSPFGSAFLSCDYFLAFSFCMCTLRKCSLESCIAHVPPLSGTPYNKPQTGGGAVLSH